MSSIDPNMVYDREDLREILDISKSKEKELRREGPYPTRAQLGERTYRFLGSHILDWLDDISQSDDI